MKPSASSQESAAWAGFPSTARVRASADFGRVFEHARRSAHPLLALHWKAADTPARLGLAVSRKVNTRAVVRNRIKRVLRETFRHSRLRLAGGDYVLVARPPAATAGNAQLAEAFMQLLLRSGALPGIAASGTMPPVLNSPPPSSKKPESDAG